MNNHETNRSKSEDDVESVEREWIVTNGLGGYASGTVSGRITRRFHGWLIAALPAPYGRTMMLNKLVEVVRAGNVKERLGAPTSAPREGEVSALATLVDFRLDDGLPVWTYKTSGGTIERRVLMVHDQNTTHIMYRLVDGTNAIELELEPWVNFRRHEGAVDGHLDRPYSLSVSGPRFEIAGEEGHAPLRLRMECARGRFLIENNRVVKVHYAVEDNRGYDAEGDLYSVGFFRITLAPGDKASLVATTDPWEATELMSSDQATKWERMRRARLLQRARSAVRSDSLKALVYAADQFVITPVGRAADAARARASGEDVRTLIAGYPWFTDWGRDTMISLEGITLVPGRFDEAGYILRTFASFVRNGLIPNLFPEGKNAGLYHTADATLWFFHAIDRYLAYTQDESTLDVLLPTLLDIADAHRRGTDFGIGVDESDGLLRQGAPGYQLTWMDAKVGDLVVTPRRGKAVEINALYYNALRLLERWTQTRDAKRSSAFGEAASRFETSFNARFWNEGEGYLYDVVDQEGGGNDASLRPNQVLAISLANPVLTSSRWASVIGAIERKLLTPVGLRTLSPDDPNYKAKYFGDLRARDMAYHQGTVWPWLIGPFIDAWLRVHPGDLVKARAFLDGFQGAIANQCVGTIGEICDGSAPFTGRGCVAQAWSVAEVLRSHAKLAGALP